MNDQFKQVIDRQLSSLAWDNQRSQDVLRQVRGETKVKKKMSFSLVMALTLILVAGIAVAAVTINRAPVADAVTRARQVLADKYGLTPAAMGVFYASEKQMEGDTWTITFTGDGMPYALVGEYTVVLKEGEDTVATWTYDEADKAIVESGSLDSPAWGVKQIEKGLVDVAAKEEAIHKHMRENPDAFKPAAGFGPTPPVANPQDGDSYAQGMHMREATPAPDDLSRDKALEIAKAALMDEFGLSKETMDKAEITDALYRKAVDSDKTTWSLHFYVVVDGVELGLGVMIDAKTGEILSSGITTGGNG